jgi:transcriptional regulator with XRE-family HTH domain
MANLTETFSANLLNLRTLRRLTQERLASDASLSVSYISMLERKRRLPPLPTLEKLAKALRVEPHELLKPGIASHPSIRRSARAA